MASEPRTAERNVLLRWPCNCDGNQLCGGCELMRDVTRLDAISLYTSRVINSRLVILIEAAP
jgi:hypothetical protein